MPNTKSNSNIKVLVALSGGVDSAVCAHLLREQNYKVECAIMHLHDSAQAEAEIKAAEQIAITLNLPMHVLDYRAEFKENVMDYLTKTYIKGRTPNPCIECNRHLKFGAFFEAAKKLKCDKIATGHYAQILREPDKAVANLTLCKAKDISKDQSYVLHFLNQEQLSKIILPLGQLSKNEVRSIAKKLNLPCAEKPESQDICFIPDGDYASFIKQHSPSKSKNIKPGNIKTQDGKIVGQHKGLINYTIGQRRGVDIAFGEPMYVTKIDAENNELIMGTREQALKTDVEINDFSWIAGNPPAQKFSAQVKLRYRHTQVPCTVEIANDTQTKVKLILDNPVDAITPGQFGVLYNNNTVLGGGVIK